MSKHAALAQAARTVLESSGDSLSALRELDRALGEYEAAQSQRKFFEITLPGFYGGSDETDERVLWVMGPSEDIVREHVPAEAVVDVMDLEPPAEDVDFFLPAHADRLRDRLTVLMKRLAKNETRYVSATLQDATGAASPCIVYGDDIVATVCHDHALASRIAACMNACEDVLTEELEAVQSRDDLIAVLTAQGMRP